MSPLERLDELARRVDAFFARVAERYPGGLACRAGCDDCCRQHLTVTSIEAAAIRRHLAALPEGDRQALARRGHAPSERACPALDASGRCGIYAARPIVCRSHGLPIRFAPPEGSSRGAKRRSLPVVDACAKNFAGRELASIDADCVLDQATLSAVLGALDAAYADATGAPRGQRTPLAAVLAEG